MHNTSIQLYSPGKLFLAGEYAVTKPQQPAIVAAVDMGLHFQVDSSQDDQSHVHSNAMADSWTFDYATDWAVNGSWAYIQASIQLLKDYLKHQRGVQFVPANFVMNIDSNIQGTSGQKLGLGSSAAVVAGTVSSLNAFWHLDLDWLTRFKIAGLAHYMVQGNGSLADVAASISGGVILYQGSDVAALLETKNTLPKQQLYQLVDADWPGLSIQSLDWPSDWHISLAATQTSADTKTALKQVSLPESFYENSHQIVASIVQAINQHDYTAFRQGLLLNQRLLNQALPSGYLTGKLTTFLNTITAHRVAGKVSGAGFGDNGFTVTTTKDLPDPLTRTWAQSKILIKSLALAPSLL